MTLYIEYLHPLSSLLVISSSLGCQLLCFEMILLVGFPVQNWLVVARIYLDHGLEEFFISWRSLSALDVCVILTID
jgi:hypothetical protein